MKKPLYRKNKYPQVKVTCECGRCFTVFMTKDTAPALIRCYWTKKDDNLLGKLSDEKVAKMANRTLKAVKRRREKLKIGKYSNETIHSISW